MKKIFYKRKSPIDKFFKQRILNRIFEWYTYDDLEYRISNYDRGFNEILTESISYFLNENRIEKCFYSQGDPNSFNILKCGYFLDFSTSGLNPILSEVCMTFWSFLVVDCFLAPKYHSNSLFNSLENKEYYRKFENKAVANGPIINGNFIRTSKMRKEYVKRYLYLFERCNLIDSNIKYHFIVRMVSIFNLNELELQDKLMVLYCAIYIFRELSINENTLNTLINLVEKCEVA